MVSRRPKNPDSPAGTLTRTGDDMIEILPVLWRIHRTTGPHVLAWNGFRTFGPLRTARFDPHPPNCGTHPGRGVSYAALDVATAVAEVFQQTRTVRAASDVRLTAWTPTRPLRLLDLSGDWALHNGASHSLYAAPRRTCRNWSRAIRGTWPDLDGLWAPSTMTGQSVVALYEHAADSFPPRPSFTRALSNPYVWVLITAAANRVGYTVH